MEIGKIFDQIVLQLEYASSLASKVRLVRQFAKKHTSPIVESGRAVFYYVSEEALTVALEGDWTGWEPTAFMTYLPDTPLWFRVEYFPEDARIEYRVVVNGHPRLDPNNPQVSISGMGTHSWFAMPKYFSPREIADPALIRRGTVEQHWMNSKNLNDRRTFWICLPPGYNNAKKYPVAYINDGDGYLYYMDFPRVMDYLIETKQVSPFIAVLVKSNNPEKEYAFYFPYFRFITDELVPWVEENYAVNAERSARMLVGSSLGALSAAYIARRRPNIYGLVVGQSGNFGYQCDTLIEDYAAAKNLDLRFHLIVGSYETTHNGNHDENDTLLSANRRFVGLLRDKGYTVSYAEYPEGHQWRFWQAHIGEALRFHWGRKI